MKTKNEWLEILHRARAESDYSQQIDSWGWGLVEVVCWHTDSFIFNCISALWSKNEAGVEELVKRMNDNPLYSATKILKSWNSSKSPIRNFLMVRSIDYPENLNVLNK